MRDDFDVCSLLILEHLSNFCFFICLCLTVLHAVSQWLCHCMIHAILWKEMVALVFYFFWAKSRNETHCFTRKQNIKFVAFDMRLKKVNIECFWAFHTSSKCYFIMLVFCFFYLDIGFWECFFLFLMFFRQIKKQLKSFVVKTALLGFN